MRSLAARIFVSIALANLVVSVAVGIVFGASFERMHSEHDAMTVDVLRAEGLPAAQAIEEGDETGALEILRTIAVRTGLSSVVVTPDRVVAPIALEPSEVASVRAAVDAASRATNGWGSADEWIALTPRHHIAVALQRRRPPGMLGLTPPLLQLALVPLLAALGSFALARWLSRPIRALREAAHKVTAGDLTVRVAPSISPRADAEVAGLAADFDRMTSRVEMLLAARERLLRDVSHELRSPLTRLSLALEVARQTSTPESADALDRIARETERLEELVGLVLTMARLDNAGAIDLGQVLRLDEIVLEVRGDAEYEARSTGRRVEASAIDAVTLKGNPELLRQALENVMRNALRFAPVGTAIEIALVANASEAVFTVRDHGPGVPPEHLEDIFRPFTRLSTARERDSGGAGLGLAITDRAIRLHGGSARADIPEGGGLRITLAIPNPDHRAAQ